LTSNEQIRQDNTCGGKVYFKGVSDAPAAMGSVPAILNIWVPLYLCIHPLTQNYQILVATHVGMWIVFTASHAPTPNAPQFWGSLLFMRKPFVAELPNLKW